MRSEKHVNAFFENLDKKLKTIGVNKHIYSLGRKKEDTTCLNFEKNKWLVEKEEEKIICNKIEEASVIFAGEISFSDEEKNQICSAICDEYKKNIELSHFSIIEIYNFCYDSIMNNVYTNGYIKTLKVYLNLFQRIILKEINEELTIDSLEIDLEYNQILFKYIKNISKLISMLKNNILDKDYSIMIMISLLILYNSFIEDKEKYNKVKNDLALAYQKDIDFNFDECNEYLKKILKR